MSASSYVSLKGPALFCIRLRFRSRGDEGRQALKVSSDLLQGRKHRKIHLIAARIRHLRDQQYVGEAHVLAEAVSRVVRVARREMLERGEPFLNPMSIPSRN